MPRLLAISHRVVSTHSSARSCEQYYGHFILNSGRWNRAQDLARFRFALVWPRVRSVPCHSIWQDMRRIYHQFVCDRDLAVPRIRAVNTGTDQTWPIRVHTFAEKHFGVWLSCPGRCSARSRDHVTWHDVGNAMMAANAVSHVVKRQWLSMEGTLSDI